MFIRWRTLSIYCFASGLKGVSLLFTSKSRVFDDLLGDTEEAVLFPSWISYLSWGVDISVLNSLSYAWSFEKMAALSFFLLILSSNCFILFSFSSLISSLPEFFRCLFKFLKLIYWVPPRWCLSSLILIDLLSTDSGLSTLTLSPCALTSLLLTTSKVRSSSSSSSLSSSSLIYTALISLLSRFWVVYYILLSSSFFFMMTSSL